MPALSWLARPLLQGAHYVCGVVRAGAAQPCRAAAGRHQRLQVQLEGAAPAAGTAGRLLRRLARGSQEVQGCDHHETPDPAGGDAACDMQRVTVGSNVLHMCVLHTPHA